MISLFEKFKTLLMKSKTPNSPSIIIDTKLNVSKDFKLLVNSLQGCNWCVSFESIQFKYNPKHEFNALDISYLDLGELDEGELSLSNFYDVRENLNYYLSMGSEFEPIEDKLIIAKRIETFWILVQKYISLLPDKVYEYKLNEKNPNIGHLDDICYILLHQSSGLVIHFRFSD